jgi:hypothetical protein
MDLELLAQLLPAPATMKDFHYHTDLEAVTGTCGRLEAARLLGISVAETAWRLVAANSRAMIECRRYIVPTLQALFTGRAEEAERLAGPPVTLAAQYTLDLLYTALKLAREDFSATEERALHTIDLRLWRPDAQRHDSVYGGAILDGNRNTLPSGASTVPAKLRFDDGQVRPVRGLGVLPHSGMAGPRDCWMRYELPPGVFARFEATVGMHAELVQDGAADFVVELDGREVFRSGKRTAVNAALPITVELGGRTQLTLKVEDANNGATFWNNHALWAQPRLEKGTRS